MRNTAPSHITPSVAPGGVMSRLRRHRLQPQHDHHVHHRHRRPTITLEDRPINLHHLDKARTIHIRQQRNRKHKTLHVDKCCPQQRHPQTESEPTVSAGGAGPVSLPRSPSGERNTRVKPRRHTPGTP